LLKPPLPQKAEGELDAILRMAAKGWASKDGARAAIEALVITATITRAQADAALAALA
jgi:hypothetical protein